MAVFRVEKTKNYTCMSNYHLRDRNLSLKATGLLSVMLSLPEDWDYTLAGLSRICKEGIDAIRGAVKELEKAGYIVRNRIRHNDGTLGGMEYIIRELPEQPVHTEESTETLAESEVDGSDASSDARGHKLATTTSINGLVQSVETGAIADNDVNECVENSEESDPDKLCFDVPTLESPTLENPTLEKPVQLNKDILTTEGVSKDYRDIMFFDKCINDISDTHKHETKEFIALKQQVGYNNLSRKSYTMLDKVLGIMSEVMYGDRKEYTVNGMRVPDWWMKSRVRRITAEKFEKMMDRLENTQGIRKLKPYIISSLYNAGAMDNIYVDHTRGRVCCA